MLFERQIICPLNVDRNTLLSPLWTDLHEAMCTIRTASGSGQETRADRTAKHRKENKKLNGEDISHSTL